MNTKFYRGVIFCAGAILLAAGPACGQSWIGESVIPKKPAKEIRLSDVISGKQSYSPISGFLPWKVRDEREGWLRIFDGRRDGWAEKADFVLARDAPAYFQGRVQANPKDTWALHMRAVGWQKKGEYDKAIQDLTDCIRLNPSESSYYTVRGLAWQQKRQYDNAISDYTAAIRLKPDDAIAHNNRGTARRAKKEYDKVFSDFNEAMRLDPLYSTPINNMAWLLATCPDAKYRNGRRAVELAKKACELTNWKNDDAIDSLASAYAETGDFKRAIQYQQQALGLPNIPQETLEEYRQRLSLYELRQPYREP
jgi:tetratricopeptide (TPR) repeat protein